MNKWSVSHQIHTIMTQSTAPGRLMSVAKNTISSPWSVVILLCDIIKCGITNSNDPCHLQLAPGHGHKYGRNSHVSSWSTFSVYSNDAEQPQPECLHGNLTFDATYAKQWRKLVLHEDARMQNAVDLDSAVRFHFVHIFTFSIAKFRILPRDPRHVGQQLNLDLQLEQTKWPLWHCKIGGNT